jgi:hypothetical protein
MINYRAVRDPAGAAGDHHTTVATKPSRQEVSGVDNLSVIVVK